MSNSSNYPTNVLGTGADVTGSTVPTSSTTTTTSTTGYNSGATGYTTGSTTGYSTGVNTGAEQRLTRSEERLLVGKEQVQSGVASLNKYVTTEHASTSVPVSKETAYIEREPITAADNVNPTIGEDHVEVALRAERAVAAKETVPVEKVRLHKEVVQGVQNVDADLRKEHINYSGGATVQPGVPATKQEY